MTSALRKRTLTRFGTGARDWRPGGTRGQPFVIVGLGVIASVVLVGLSVVAGAFVVHAVGGAQSQTRNGSSATVAIQQSLSGQSTLVERRRAAVAAYAAKLTEFKAATTRPPGSVGINLSGAEVSRREGVLNGLVLDCIDAVDGYNLGARALSAAQLRAFGLPEGFVWAVDCASGQ